MSVYRLVCSLNGSPHDSFTSIHRKIQEKLTRAKDGNMPCPLNNEQVRELSKNMNTKTRLWLGEETESELRELLFPEHKKQRPDPDEEAIQVGKKELAVIAALHII